MFRRATALAVVGVWLLTIFGSLWHASDEAHSYCLEHRAFEEASQSPGKDGIHASSAADDHEVCAFADFDRPASDGAPVMDFASAAPSAAPPSSAPTVLAPEAAIPLLLLAPKCSPPASIV